MCSFVANGNCTIHQVLFKIVQSNLAYLTWQIPCGIWQTSQFWSKEILRQAHWAGIPSGATQQPSYSPLAASCNLIYYLKICHLSSARLNPTEHALSLDSFQSIKKGPTDTNFSQYTNGAPISAQKNLKWAIQPVDLTQMPDL